jgi:hypothetical protein
MVELRGSIVEQLPKHEVGLIDELPRLALAAWYAHLMDMPAVDSQDRARRLLDEAGPLREGLLVAAEALAHRGLLDAEKVAEMRGGQGNLDRANDLVALSALFKQAWPRLAGKTAVEQAEVDRAAALGPELLVALGVKGLAERRGPSSETRDNRIRAYTLGRGGGRDPFPAIRGEKRRGARTLGNAVRPEMGPREARESTCFLTRAGRPDRRSLC